ncbi:MAG: flavodoxin family protein [Candidatus Aminicenantes bacterium]|nr:flavodoxin family protein [Candidatus Aminicenantes bacterium]
MNRHLLVFLGSPRKDSNSTILAMEAAKAAEKAGASVEIIHLAELNLNPCLACESCRDKGPGECIQEDDMKEIYPKLKEAEAIILAHPVYWFSLNAQIKLFIDRWYAFGGDDYACFKDKKVGIILTYADRDVFTSGGVNALRAYQDIFNYLGAEIVGMVYASASEKGEVKHDPYAMEEAIKLGQKIVS